MKPASRRRSAVDGNTLARILGVSGKVVYDLTKAGIIERGPGRMFDLEDAVRRYCDHLGQQVGLRAPELSVAQAVK